jgi:hypothetical protein
MTLRVLAALPLLLGFGCVDESRPLLVAPGESVPQGRLSRSPKINLGSEVDPATTKRVLAVGGKLIDANPQAGIRPMFITVGAPHPEIFHKGGGTRHYQIFVSEGLVKRCQSDEQLAAVLALELGKIVSARESRLGPSRPDSFRLPPDVPIGTDAGGTFGPADGTRMMEHARLDPKRPRPGKPSAPATPEALARTYLGKAGFAAATLADVGPLLRQAEEHYQVEKSISTAEIGPPVVGPQRPKQ